MKGKSIARLKADLWNKLRPEVGPAALANEISEFVRRHLGKSGRNANLANNLTAYLTQKYSVANRNTGQLRSLIDLHPQDLNAFLVEISFKEFQALAKIDHQPPRPTRVKRQTETERTQRRKKSKNSYDRRRRRYREGLIIEQFGTFPRSSTLDPSLSTPSECPCLDILFNGGAIRMAGGWDSLENLFGVDRHRFPKSLPRKRSRRNVLYDIDAFIECLIYLLINRDGGKQWLPDPTQRDLVLRGIIIRAHRCSPEIGVKVIEKLLPYLR